jgi:26S proteasome regulatory subunit N1
MIFGEKGARTSLSYLLKGTNSNFTEWGHEYVSNLASDIGREYELRLENNEPFEELLEMVDKIIPYFILNNAEHDAIDLMLIVDKLEDIKQYVSVQNFSKVHMYLSAVCGYSTDQDELVKILTILYEISLKLEEYTIALRIAIKLDDHDKIREVFTECPDDLIKKQLAFNAARQKIFIPNLSEEENEIISNRLLSKFYIDLAKDLEVQDPKHPRDVFKVHLEENYKGGDNKQITLYNIYVNGFVNAGLTKDTLMLDDDEADKKSSFALKIS